MIPDVVVDVGNTRIKWGLVARDGPSLQRTVSLPEDPAVWQAELERLPQPLARPRTWVLASVRPARSQRLADWLRARDDRVVLLEKAAQLPLNVGLPNPDHAGIDRLLNAVAAKTQLPPHRGAVLISAGSAVTMDWLDEHHTFCGGAIAPGLDLMAETLHRNTALLPLVQVTSPIPPLPANATIPAMQVGIFLAVAGGIREAVRLYSERARTSPRVFFTGGQAPLLAEAMGLLNPSVARSAPWTDFLLWPEQTLVGILRSVECLP